MAEVTVLGGGVTGVEHREQVGDQALGGPLGQLVLLLEHSLAVVLEVGLEPPELVEVVVALALEGDDVVLDDQLRLGQGVLAQLAGVLVAASGPPALGAGVIGSGFVCAVLHVVTSVLTETLPEISAVTTPVGLTISRS